MKYTASAIVAALATAGAAVAADSPPVTRFSPPDPALRLVERSDSYDKGSFAKWSGTLTLTGKLVVEFDRGPPEDPEADTAGVAVFEPDAKSRARLPAAQNYYAAPVSTVWLEKTPLDVLPSLIGRNRALQIIRSKVPRYELAVSVQVTSLSTSVECDHRSYSLEYAAITLVRPKVLAQVQAKNLGC